MTGILTFSIRFLLSILPFKEIRCGKIAYNEIISHTINQFIIGKIEYLKEFSFTPKKLFA